MLTEVIILLVIPLLFIVYCFLVISVLFSPTSIKSIINGAPPVPSPKKDIKLALKSVGLSKGDSFYDLGSCTGRAVIIADKSFKADACGLEWSIFWTVFSKINLFLHNSKGRIRKENFLKTDLSKADVVYSYTSKSLMKRLEKKILDENLQIKVISYCFSFPNLEYEKKVKTDSGKDIFIYKI